LKCAFCGNLLDESRPDCPTCGKPKTPAPADTQPPRRDGDEISIRAVRLDDVLVGRYRLEQKIGEGGMGTVYLANDKELDRKVAVKLLGASYVADKDVVERFEREARLTARLDHPNIVPVYDVGRHEGRPFIVMKKLEGQSLAGVLREKGGFTRDETLKLFRQLAAGVDFIHAQGFIHRDIKAGNIYVGSDGQATILDFGILRTARGKEALTRTGMVMGTPHYMAPEQAQGSKNIDHRVDLYALAVVIFECLTGTLPFEADSELRLIQMQAHQPPPDLLERAPWIPKPVAEVMKKALSKLPEERFSTATELVKALENSWAQTAPQLVPNTVMRKASAVNESTAPSLRAQSGEAPIRPLASDSFAPGKPLAEVKLDGIEPSTSELERAVKRSRARPLLLLLVLGVVAAGTYAALSSNAMVAHPVADAGTKVPIAVPAVDAGALEVVAEADGGEEHDPDAGVLAMVEPLDGGEDDDADAGALAVKKPRRGKLTVVSTHKGEQYWADVTVDGDYKGRTPVNVWLDQGSYKLKVDRPGMKSVSRQIWVASGKSKVVQIELRQ
jgi:eukaryotic-like serine/threonine-protein kinase